MTQRKKLVGVALPLEAINIASAREKSIRHGDPSMLHPRWARRPLAVRLALCGPFSGGGARLLTPVDAGSSWTETSL